jgi:hypothetical protein
MSKEYRQIDSTKRWPIVGAELKVCLPRARSSCFVKDVPIAVPWIEHLGGSPVIQSHLEHPCETAYLRIVDLKVPLDARSITRQIGEVFCFDLDDNLIGGNVRAR